MLRGENHNMEDTLKVCFITCVNDERCYAESLLYIKHLVIPANIQIEYVVIRNAASMASGYNQGMNASQAKYKIYLHQDVFLLRKNIIQEILDIFKRYPQIGMVGLAGCETLPESYCWGEAPQKYGCISHALQPEYTSTSTYGKVATARFAIVDAIDGLFIATQYDIPWREDLFKGFHFYDVSQGLEFYRYGYKIAVPNQEEPWCLHACGIKELDTSYWKYQKVCIAEY